MNDCNGEYSRFVVNLNNFEHNLNLIRNRLKKELILVVKNNAYGNGAVVLSHFARDIGVKKFAVISLSEAVKLRESGLDSTIIVMGKIPTRDFERILSLRVQPTIFDLQELDLLESLCKKQNEVVSIHVNVETGMNRLGTNFEIARQIIYRVERSNFLRIAGVYSHFSTPKDKIYSEYQINKFRSFISNLSKRYYLHFANSVPAVKYKDLEFDAVRIGILSYGIDQSASNLNFKNTSSLFSKVLKIIDVNKGDSVGYDRKYIAESSSKIAVLQIGYGDGLPYNFNNCKVFINGKFYRVVGSVCMDHIFVEIDDGVHLFDDAEIFGENVDIQEIALTLNTIPYDIMVKMNDDIVKEYFYDGKLIAKSIGDEVCWK